MAKKIETLDPELYEYLQENDKSLLEFEDSDVDIGEAESEKSVDSDVEMENSAESSESEADDEEVEADSKSQDVGFAHFVLWKSVHLLAEGYLFVERWLAMRVIWKMMKNLKYTIKWP